MVESYDSLFMFLINPDDLRETFKSVCQLTQFMVHETKMEDTWEVTWVDLECFFETIFSIRIVLTVLISKTLGMVE